MPHFRFFSLGLFTAGSVNLVIILYSWRSLQVNTNCDIIVSSRCRHAKSLGIGLRLACCRRNNQVRLSVMSLASLGSRLRNKRWLGVSLVNDFIWLLTRSLPPLTKLNLTTNTKNISRFKSFHHMTISE